MLIRGFTKTTLLDFPGRVAATIFTGGCNFRCPFCHNGELVLHPDVYPAIPEEEILSHLKKRFGMLTGVCITGGEPTLMTDLSDFIAKIKSLGYAVKLDTNGTNPVIISSLLKQGLLDYIAMDIKSGESGYDLACGISTDIDAIRQSIDIICHGASDYEFRTTVVKGIHRKQDFEGIARLISGAKQYFIQSYKESESVIQQGLEAFDEKELLDFASIVRPAVGKVSFRGIEL